MMNPNLSWYWGSEEVDIKPMECPCKKICSDLGKEQLEIAFPWQVVSQMPCAQDRTEAKGKGGHPAHPQTLMSRVTVYKYKKPSGLVQQWWMLNGCKKSELGKLKFLKQKTCWESSKSSLPVVNYKVSAALFLMGSPTSSNISWIYWATAVLQSDLGLVWAFHSRAGLALNGVGFFIEEGIFI